MKKKKSKKLKLIKFLLKCRYYIFSFRRPLKIGFLRLYNEENTIIPCLMSVVNMFDKIVLIYSKIDDSSLELVKEYIKKNHYEKKIIIHRYPYEVYTQHSPKYYEDFEWKNTLAAYYQFGYDICCKLGRFRNGFIAKVDADQIYMNNCFNEIEETMIKEKYAVIINSFGGYNGYVNKDKNVYMLSFRPELGYINGSEGDHLCVPFGLCNKISFDMSITKEYCWETMKFPKYFYKLRIPYDKPMWFHFNQKTPLKGVMKPLPMEQYCEYKEKILPLLEKSNSAYTHLEIISEK